MDQGSRFREKEFSNRPTDSRVAEQNRSFFGEEAATYLDKINALKAAQGKKGIELGDSVDKGRSA